MPFTDNGEVCRPTSDGLPHTGNRRRPKYRGRSAVSIFKRFKRIRHILNRAGGVDEIDLAEHGGGGGDIGKDIEAVLRKFGGALRHRRRLHDGPAQRCTNCRNDPEIVKAAAAAEVEHRNRPAADFRSSNPDGHDRIDRLFRRKLPLVHGQRGLIGDDVRDVGIVITRPASGQRRRKIRENLSDDSQSMPLVRAAISIKAEHTDSTLNGLCPPHRGIRAIGCNCWGLSSAVVTRYLCDSGAAFRRRAPRRCAANKPPSLAFHGSSHGRQDTLSRLIYRARHPVQERVRRRESVPRAGRLADRRGHQRARPGRHHRRKPDAVP